MVCSHKKRTTTELRGCLWPEKEDYVYLTAQCIDCGYFPNSDLEQHSLKMDCAFCRGVLELGSKALRENTPFPKFLSRVWIRHMKMVHGQDEDLAYMLNTDDYYNRLKSVFHEAGIKF